MTIPLCDQVPLLSLSSCDRDGVTVLSLRGELDYCGSSALRAYLSDIRRPLQPRSVADLTGLLSWFDVHDTVEEAVSLMGAQ